MSLVLFFSYENIANKHPHFENAGMMFDKETLEPLYKLIIGKSEDSNALYISKKMGIKDNVKLLDFDDFAIVHKPMDKLNNVEVFYKNEFISINAKRLKLQLKAEDLYPKDYDLNSLFISFEKRKLEKDIKRGSKKALKKIQKEIKNNR